MWTQFPAISHVWCHCCSPSRTSYAASASIHPIVIVVTFVFPHFFLFRSLCKSYSKNIFFRLMGKSLFYGSLFFCILPTFLLGKKKFSYSHKSNSSRQLWKPRNSCCSHSHFYGFIEDHCVVIISFGFDVRTQVITPSTHRAKPLLTFCLLLLLEISSTVRKQHSSV